MARAGAPPANATDLMTDAAHDDVTVDVRARGHAPRRGFLRRHAAQMPKRVS